MRNGPLTSAVLAALDHLSLSQDQAAQSVSNVLNQIKDADIPKILDGLSEQERSEREHTHRETTIW